MIPDAFLINFTSISTRKLMICKYVLFGLLTADFIKKRAGNTNWQPSVYERLERGYVGCYILKTTRDYSTFDKDNYQNVCMMFSSMHQQYVSNDFKFDWIIIPERKDIPIKYIWFQICKTKRNYSIMDEFHLLRFDKEILNT